ncbi:MAG: ABC transporter permease [Lachnospiraceae bacterium]|jgi:ribose/xylose/arabinose/galactoside ABC-type transport system permease subunit|nr:ABC transporter permease [Lachnospiraceae bacterium]
MKAKTLNFISRQKLLIVLILVLVIASCVSEYFFTYTNMVNLFTQVSAYGIVACGMLFVVISGEFDISVGSVMCFTSTAAVALMNMADWGWALALVAVLGIGIGVGCIYGFLVIKLNISSFIATLAGSIFYRGLAYLITGDGKPLKPELDFYSKIASTKVLKIPTIVYFFLVCVLLTYLILKYTRFGRNIYATGCNYEVARFTGIHVVFYKTASFVVCSYFAVLAGILYSSRQNSANPSVATDAGLTALSAVVLGGASLSGGKGTADGMFIGVMILGLLTNALNMMGIDTYIQQVLKGALLIIFVCMERYSHNRRMDMI